MEIEEEFTNGKYKRRRLIDVWRGDDSCYALSYMKDLCSIFSREYSQNEKVILPSRIDIERIRDDYSAILSEKGLVKLHVTNKYIVIESFSNHYISIMKRLLFEMLRHPFTTMSSTLRPQSEDIVSELMHEPLKISKIFQLTENRLLLLCRQNIDGKEYSAFESVGIDFLRHLESEVEINSLIIEMGRWNVCDLNYPIIEMEESNIELIMSFDDAHPQGNQIKLKPILGENNEPLLGRNGELVYLKTSIVRGKPRHQVNYFDYPMKEPEFSKGSKDLLKMVGDPSYIQYCMREWDDFYITDETIYELQNNYTPQIISIKLEEICHDVLEYSVQKVDQNFQISQVAIERNREKLAEIEDEEFEDWFQNYQKYGNDHSGSNRIYGLDDDTINDAFEGDPENYWNID